MLLQSHANSISHDVRYTETFVAANERFFEGLIAIAVSFFSNKCVYC